MWYYYVIGAGAFLAFVGFIVYAALRHNKYFFWQWETFVDDRNGVRKPGKKAKNLFGLDPTGRVKNKNSLMKQIADLERELPSTKFEISIDEDARTFEIAFDDVKLIDGGVRVWSHKQKYTSFMEEANPEENVNAFPLKIKSVNEEDGENYLGSFHDY